MKEIPLTKGYVAIVDDDDYDRISKNKWSASLNKAGYCYATRRAHNWESSTKAGLRHMHHEVLGVYGKIVDHKDRNTLNNTKGNLRVATKSMNGANSKKQSDCSSKYKGVIWHKRLGKWTAQIAIKNRRYHLGVFKDEEEAAGYYDIAAEAWFGEFATLNGKRQHATLESRRLH